ncbi:hypothetical protein H9P43_006072 [Blastocladiella emersonii ATCC 22665]|nr:hypothetical protein H9P43_006072 [Blastocladiella emersonii ATCC 22665]
MVNVIGKVCIVTGAASGYGRELTLRLFGKGAKVVLVDINADAGSTFAAELNAREAGSPARALFVRADVTSMPEFRAAFDAAVQKWGSVTVVFNNAGVVEKNAFHADAQCDWRRVIDIDLNSVILGTQLAIEYMSKPGNGGGGTIVNVASMAGLLPIPDAPVYCAAKHGVVGFSTSLNRFARHGIRVNAVAPFFSDTPLVRAGRANSASFDKTLAKVALVPVATVVDAMMHCVEDDSMIGRVLTVTPKGIHAVPKRSAKL